MDKYTNPDAHPTPAGEFTDGDPVLDIPRTIMTAAWPNMMAREAINLVEKAGLTLDGNDFTQWFQAVMAIAQQNGFQTGDIKYSYRSAVPAGWLLLNGQTIGSAASAATALAGDAAEALYLFLWDAFDNSICPVAGGRGLSAQADWDADKTIQLMDDRGEFHRVWDNGRGVDAGRVLGSTQSDEIKAHTHDINLDSPGLQRLLSGQNNFVEDWDGDLPSAETSSTGGSETRPRNRAVSVFIKL